MIENVPRTYGALLLGGLFESTLTGFVYAQTIIYFKLYGETDVFRVKALVLTILFLDTIHTAFIWASLWIYLINLHYDPLGIHTIPWTLSITITTTAALSFAVYMFFAHRIYMLSKRWKWHLPIIVIILAAIRLGAAIVTTADMIKYPDFLLFQERYAWTLTVGLALSSVIDVITTVSLCVLLRKNRSSVSRYLNKLINSLILYAFEMGFVTCAGTIISMIFWLLMSNNLIFMGLHFVIGKFYANTLLFTLNSRKKLRSAHPGAEGAVLYLETRHEPAVDTGKKIRFFPSTPSLRRTKKVEITIQTSVQYDGAKEPGP